MFDINELKEAETLEEALKKINELDQKNKQLEAELEKYKNIEYKTLTIKAHLLLEIIFPIK